MTQVEDKERKKYTHLNNNMPRQMINSNIPRLRLNPQLTRQLLLQRLNITLDLLYFRLLQRPAGFRVRVDG